MRFRPANISLINRRHYLPRLLLILSSFKENDPRTLTGHYISFPYRWLRARNSPAYQVLNNTFWSASAAECIGEKR